MTAALDITVQVQILAHGRGLTLPIYATDLAAGCDVAAAVPADMPIVLAPGRRCVVPTGFCLALPVGHELQVRPRSGLALRHGITVLNAPGTIDADYRGELKVLLVNLGSEPFTITRGMRIAQLVLAPVARARWATQDALPDTERAAGGFGSTGTDGLAIKPR